MARIIVRRPPMVLPVSPTVAGSGTVGSGGGGGGFTPDSGFAVSSTFADGADLTITDSMGRLGAKSPVEPLNVFLHTADRNPDSSWSRTTSNVLSVTGTWMAGGGGAALPTGHTGYTRNDMSVSNSIGLPQLSFTGGNNAKAMRVSKRYYGWDWSTGVPTNYKQQRIWDSADLHTLIALYGFDSEGFFAGIYVEGSDESPPNKFAVVTPPLHFSQWLTDETFFKASSAQGVRDGEFYQFTNGIRIYDPDFLAITHSSGFPNHLSKWNGDQISNNNESAGSYLYCCFDYFDDSWYSVFWSDEASYQDTGGTGTGTEYKREYCPPFDTWSTTSGTSTVKVHNRLGEFSSLTGKYLYVRVADGTVYRVGQKT